MENKRGQGLSTNAIILIILGIVILVMLILGFTIGWSKLLPFLSSDNVDSIVNGCKSACVAQGVYGFCTETITLVPSEGDEVRTTCEDLATETKYLKYGVEKCPAITCPVIPEESVAESNTPSP